MRMEDEMCDKIIGYDVSRDIDDPRVICEDCANKHGDEGGSPIYAGYEWGRVMDRHCCHHCGHDLSEDGLVLITIEEG